MDFTSVFTNKNFSIVDYTPAGGVPFGKPVGAYYVEYVGDTDLEQLIRCHFTSEDDVIFKHEFHKRVSNATFPFLRNLTTEEILDFIFPTKYSTVKDDDFYFPKSFEDDVDYPRFFDDQVPSRERLAYQRTRENADTTKRILGLIHAGRGGGSSDNDRKTKLETEIAKDAAIPGIVTPSTTLNHIPASERNSARDRVVLDQPRSEYVTPYTPVKLDINKGIPKDNFSQIDESSRLQIEVPESELLVKWPQIHDTTPNRKPQIVPPNPVRKTFEEMRAEGFVWKDYEKTKRDLDKIGVPKSDHRSDGGSHSQSGVPRLKYELERFDPAKHCKKNDLPSISGSVQEEVFNPYGYRSPYGASQC